MKALLTVLSVCAVVAWSLPEANACAGCGCSAKTETKTETKVTTPKTEKCGVCPRSKATENEKTAACCKTTCRGKDACRVARTKAADEKENAPECRGKAAAKGEAREKCCRKNTCPAECTEECAGKNTEKTCEKTCPAKR